MGWADPGVLQARVRRLDSDDLATFVADLWGARGFETTRDGAYVTARSGGTTQVVYVLTQSATRTHVETTRDVDIVVAAGRHRAGATPATESGARFLDAADLAEMLRYAIERDVAADLCETHFGVAPEALRFPLQRRVRRAVVGVDFGTVAVVIVVSLLVAAGAGAVLGVAGPGIDNSGTTDEAVVVSETPTNVGSDDPPTAATESGLILTGAGVGNATTVPGVNETGISNASRLAQAHDRAVSGVSSYTIWFDYYAPANGSDERVQYDTDVRVQGARSSIRTSLERTGGNRVLLSTVYANGTGRYRAATGSEEFTRIDNRTPTATPRAVRFTRPAGMVRTYLTTPESSVRVAETDAAGDRYRIRGTGRPAGLPETVSEYEVTATVDQRGFVRTFEAEFSIPRDSDGDGAGGRARVRLTWTYDRLNTTAVRADP